jgi:hypothetical protein
LSCGFTKEHVGFFGSLIGGIVIKDKIKNNGKVYHTCRIQGNAQLIKIWILLNFKWVIVAVRHPRQGKYLLNLAL